MPKGKNSHPGAGDCVGSGCEWALVGRKVECIDGMGGCSAPHFCEAEESSFHSKDLQEATKKLNRILARIPADSKGRRLSFLDTNMGTFLAWVDRAGKPSKGKVVTQKDDEKTIAKALKLKGKYV